MPTLHLHSEQYFQTIYNTSISVFDIIDASCTTFSPVFIIDAYRPFLDRKISAFFQNIATFLPDYTSMDIQHLIDYFNTHLVNDIENYHPMENELLPHYHIPIWNSFDFECGYNRIDKDGKVFIKMRFTDIANWSNYLTQIFNTPFHIANTNVNMSSLYQQFVDNYTISPALFEIVMNNDPWFNMYTTPEERVAFRKKYNQPIDQ